MKVMKKVLINFIGIDVSKHTLDVALIQVNKGVKQPIRSFVISNTKINQEQFGSPLNTVSSKNSFY